MDNVNVYINVNELLKALNTIQGVCMGHECIDCPLKCKENDDCHLMMEPPSEWRINNQMYSAFNN